jgi:hypothetical protein
MRKFYTLEPGTSGLLILIILFQDIFRPDGTPFDPKETAFIRHLTML